MTASTEPPEGRRSGPGGRFADVRWLDETGSTNADVLELARQGEAEGVVVVADHQHAGRGRRGRTWEAPAGASLMFTVLLRPPADLVGCATMAISVAAATAVEELTAVSPRLKWPNDLVWPGDGSAPDRKLAGVLAEADWPAGVTASGGPPRTSGHDRVAVAVGLGLNVAWATRAPEHLADVAVALDGIVEPAEVPERSVLLAAILRELDRWYAPIAVGTSLGTERDRAVEALRAEWKRRSATLGRRVRVDLGVDDVEGVAVDVTGDGLLVVDTDEGVRRTFAVGDVHHLR